MNLQPVWSLLVTLRPDILKHFGPSWLRTERSVVRNLSDEVWVQVWNRINLMIRTSTEGNRSRTMRLLCL